MKDSEVTNVSVIIRSAGERTERACVEIARNQVGPDAPFHVVRNLPFAEAHIESLRLASQAGTRWSLFLDADVLLCDGVIHKMVQEANSIDQPFFMLNFRILDRGFDGPTYAGVHLYSSRFLQKALDYSDVARQAQRPETRVCEEMARSSLIPSLRSTELVGIHGYEQSFEDVYRTTFVRAVKFARLTDYLLRLYRTRYSTHDDYRVMLWGLLDGIVYREDHSIAPLEKPFYKEQAHSTLSALDINEKSPFAGETGFASRIIANHATYECYHTIAGDICRSERIANRVPASSHRLTLHRVARASGRRLKKMIQVALHG